MDGRRAKQYDVIVIGARCAGAPTAMLLARQGYRVLLLDKATFPSDTVSTHLVHPPGVDALRRWGLVDRLVDTGCPAIDTYAFNFGPFTLTGKPGHRDGDVSYGPRRTVLDLLLVEAASEAGAEVREAFTVEDLRVDDGQVTGVRGHSRRGATVSERARVVVGADGLHSVVARTVEPEHYRDLPPLNASYYAYWSDLPMNGRFETYVRPNRAFAAWPTHDDLTVVIGGWPYEEFAANRKDALRHYLALFELAPEFAERIGRANRETRLVGASVPNFFRKPFGPGWALVGDAGYNKDYITAQGIQDAFRDAELCAAALDQWFTGKRDFDGAMDHYQATRDAHALPMYELTAQLATMKPPPPEMQQLFAAMAGNREAMNGFARVVSGVTPAPEFFTPDNVQRILGQQPSPAPA